MLYPTTIRSCNVMKNNYETENQRVCLSQPEGEGLPAARLLICPRRGGFSAAGYEIVTTCPRFAAILRYGTMYTTYDH